MAEFKVAYTTPMDRTYEGNAPSEIRPSANIEEPIIPVNQIGQTVTEGGRFGNLLQTATAAIRAGVGSIELQTQMGGGAEPVGAESYGKEAREALREMAKANEVELTSVHTPTNIGNLSGFNPQQGNFSDEYRRSELAEVKAAIKFAADAAQGGAVVVHTGEFHRPIFDADWNKKGKWAGSFEAYSEEPEKSTVHLVDKRNGRILSEVKRNQIVYRPEWNTYEGDTTYTDDNGNTVSPGNYVDYEGNKIVKLADRVPKYDREQGLFVTKPMKWKDFVAEADLRNGEFQKEHGRTPQGDEIVTPEEAFLQAQLESQIGVAKGWAVNYGTRVKEELEMLAKVKKMLKYYEKMEENATPQERELLKSEVMSSMRTFGLPAEMVPRERKLPSEMIKDALWSIRKEIESARDMATAQTQQANEQELMKQNAVSISKFAKQRSLKGFAEAGMYALQQSEHNPYVKRDVFVAPENIFPEMGFGSHPEELLELVKGARKEMVKRLISPKIEDPSGRVDEKGNPIMVPNGDYRGISEEKAEQLAKQHIKATLDTQHLGMWWKHFKPKQGETEEQRRERFNGWFMDQVEKLSKEDVIGNIHLVDAIGATHQHLPIGQGELPLVEAIKLLKKNGYKGIINSEAYGEERFSQGRILVETWKALGTNITSSYASGGSQAPRTWGEASQSYFGRTYPPKFIFGAYSPSNDWTLWSQVPLE